ARMTALTPPCPADVASAAAKRRRPRSSSTGASASKRCRMADSSITPKRYSLATPGGIPLGNKIQPNPIHLFADGSLGHYPDAKKNILRTENKWCTLLFLAKDHGLHCRSTESWS